MKSEAARRANLKWRTTHPGAHEAYNHQWRKDRRLRLIDMLGGKCVRCGFKEHPMALDFDHIDPESKLFTISNHLNRSWERLVAEVKKCRILCANCHRIRTHVHGLARFAGRSRSIRYEDRHHLGHRRCAL